MMLHDIMPWIRQLIFEVYLPTTTRVFFPSANAAISGISKYHKADMTSHQKGGVLGMGQVKCCKEMEPDV